LQTIVTDGVAWSVSLSVCWSDMIVSPAKMAELIKMRFGLRTCVGPRNYVLDGDPDPPCKEAASRGKYRDLLTWAVQKPMKRSRCRLEYGLRWACVRWGWTLVHPGECDWTSHVWQRCSLFV